MGDEGVPTRRRRQQQHLCRRVGDPFVPHVGTFPLRNWKEIGNLAHKKSSVYCIMKYTDGVQENYCNVKKDEDDA